MYLQHKFNSKSDTGFYVFNVYPFVLSNRNVLLPPILLKSHNLYEKSVNDKKRRLRGGPPSRKWPFTKESAEERAKHRVRKGGEESAELADHAQGQHEGGPVLYHPAAADLQDRGRGR